MTRQSVCAGPAIKIKLRDSEHAPVISRFLMQLLGRLAQHEHWAGAPVCLDTLEQLRMPEELGATGRYKWMYKPLLTTLRYCS